jgi:hypothetical protein
MAPLSPVRADGHVPDWMGRLSYYNRFGYISVQEDLRMRHKGDPATPPEQVARTRSRASAQRSGRSRRRAEHHWSEPLQQRFLSVLNSTRRVDAAAFAVERTVAQANAERRRNPLLAARWDQIMDPRRQALEDAMLDRAINGIREPILVDGEEQRVRIRYSDTLGMMILRSLMPERYGPPPRSSAARARRAGEPDGGEPGAGEPQTKPADPETDMDEAEAILAELAERLQAWEASDAPQDRPVMPGRECPDPA